jgi:predicted peroxiredoxin
MSDRMIIVCSAGREDPERAILPFIVANTAAAVGKQTAVLCTIEAVWIGTEGGTDGIQYEGLPDLARLYKDFVELGGEVWLCGACTKPRGIGEDRVIEGSRIVGAGMIIEEVAEGAKLMSYT